MQTKYPRTLKVLHYFQWGPNILNKGERVIVEAVDLHNNRCMARVDKPSGKTTPVSCRAVDGMISLKHFEET